MSKIRRIWSERTGHIVFDFGEKVGELSVAFDFGAYSDNHYKNEPSLRGKSFRFWESTTIEMWGGDSAIIQGYLDKRFGCGNEPAGYVPVSELPTILKDLEAMK